MIHGRFRPMPRMRPVWSGWWVPVAGIGAVLWAVFLKFARG